jgi:hypothetical protein
MIPRFSLEESSMRNIIPAFALVCAGLLIAAATNSGQEKEKKDTVLKGKITCAKCDLGISDDCATVIVVKDKEAKKDITYYFDKKGHGKYHDDICTAAKNGTVTGTLKDDGKKKVITVKKLDYDK